MNQALSTMIGTLKDRFVCHVQRTKALVFVFIFVFVLAHEQAISNPTRLLAYLRNTYDVLPLQKQSILLLKIAQRNRQ